MEVRESAAGLVSSQGVGAEGCNERGGWSVAMVLLEGLYLAGEHFAEASLFVEQVAVCVAVRCSGKLHVSELAFDGLLW